MGSKTSGVVSLKDQNLLLPWFDQIIKLWRISREIEGVKHFRLRLEKHFDPSVMSCRICTIITRSFFTRHVIATTTDYGRPERKSPSLNSRKSTPTPKFLGTAEAYFVCHIGPNFQISLICTFIGCPWSVATTVTEAVSQAYEDLHKSPKVVGKHIQRRTTATEFLALHLDFPNKC